MSTTPTPLERALTGAQAPRRPTPLDALALARERWLTGERIDMGGLARELGISRATLYSWVGSRERLIGEVLWSFAENGLAQARAAASGAGADYVVGVFEHFIHLNAQFAPLQRFVGQDPELALRVLTSKRSPVQSRMVAAARELLDEQGIGPGLPPGLDADTLAYTLIRVAESFLYSDVVAGSTPDVDKAVAVVRALLRAEAPPNGGRRGRR